MTRPGESTVGRRHAVAATLLLVGGAVALRAMGRVWWCREGDVRPWSFDIWTAHNSQHLVDPYTITHVLHGVALYGLLWLLLRSVLSTADRGLLALGLEVAWEIGENTPAVIERYRETTLALNYYGDSVVNSVGDTLAFVGGYAVAASVPAWTSAVGFFVVDALLVLWIRDGLLLNVLMLLHPVDAIRDWQTAGRTATAVAGSLLGRTGPDPGRLSAAPADGSRCPATRRRRRAPRARRTPGPFPRRAT